MKQVLLERPLPKPINNKLRKEIVQYLGKLKSKYEGKVEIDFKWNTKGNRLTARTNQVRWETDFSKNKIRLSVDVPFYLMLFLKRYKNEAIKNVDMAIKRFGLNSAKYTQRTKYFSKLYDRKKFYNP